MATYKEKADLISIGAYQPGSDPQIDAAIAARGPIDDFLKQGVTEPSTAEGADATLGPARARSAAPSRPRSSTARSSTMAPEAGRHAAPQRDPAAAHPLVARC